MFVLLSRPSHIPIWIYIFSLNLALIYLRFSKICSVSFFVAVLHFSYKQHLDLFKKCLKNNKIHHIYSLLFINFFFRYNLCNVVCLIFNFKEFLFLLILYLFLLYFLFITTIISRLVLKNIIFLTKKSINITKNNEYCYTLIFIDSIFICILLIILLLFFLL